MASVKNHMNKCVLIKSVDIKHLPVTNSIDKFVMLAKGKCQIFEFLFLLKILQKQICNQG